MILHIQTGKDLFDAHIKKFEVKNGGWYGELANGVNGPVLYCKDYSDTLVRTIDVDENTELDLMIRPTDFENEKYKELCELKHTIRDCSIRLKEARHRLDEIESESYSDITYEKLFQQVMEVIEDTIPGYYEEHFETIAKFLIHQGVDDVSLDTVDKIKNFHIAKNEADLFNWIHNPENEKPSDIKNAPYPNELGNVLVLDNGYCVFWYEIGVDKEPYNPYEENDFDYDM